MKPKVYSFLVGLESLVSTRAEGSPSREKISPKGDAEVERISRLDTERTTRDNPMAKPRKLPNGRWQVALGRGADYAPIVDGFHCDRCLNDPTRCAWCADHRDDAGVLSCGDCERNMPHPSPIIRDAEIDRIARNDGWQPPADPPSRVVAEIKRIEAEGQGAGLGPRAAMELRVLAQYPRPAAGLASVMSEGDTIVEVSGEVITILACKRYLQPFPWKML
jgi:hypothetical protein